MCAFVLHTISFNKKNIWEMIKFLRKNNKSYTNLLIGITIFSLGNSLISFNSDIYKAFICTIGWLFIIKGILSINSFVMPLKGITKLLFILYLVQTIVIIVRGYSINYNYQWISIKGLVNFHFFAPHYILPYLLPLFILIGSSRVEFRTLLKINYLFNILFFLFFIFNIQIILKGASLKAAGKDLNFLSTELATPTIYFFVMTGFIFFCKKYISKLQWRLNLVAWVLSVITVAIAARRGTVFILLLLGLAAAYLYVLSFKGQKKIIGIFLIIIVFLGLSATYFYAEDSLFLYLNKRGVEDTRSGVDEALLSQMSNKELWFGKGLNGRYYMGGQFIKGHYDGWRYGSETGFYNLVLKGGYTFAITYILLLLIPAIKGLFKSKNILTKALGLYIIISLIELFPFGWLMFNLKFFIIWIGVLLCSNKYIRNMSDIEIKQRFF